MKNIIELAFTIVSAIVVAALLSGIFFALSGSIIVVLAVIIVPATFIVYTAIVDFKDSQAHDAFMIANR